MFVQVEDTKYLRDTHSMALINKDYTARDEYYAKLRLVKSQKDEINTIKSDIDSLRGDMKDIKSLLEQLLDKGIHG